MGVLRQSTISRYFLGSKKNNELVERLIFANYMIKSGANCLKQRGGCLMGTVGRNELHIFLGL